MKYAIEILKKEQDSIIEELRKGIDTDNNIKKIAEIKKAIAWLLKLEELNFEKVSEYDILELPNMQTGWSWFRIMNDCETDNREDWIEFKTPGLVEGDFIISHKPL